MFGRTLARRKSGRRCRSLNGRNSQKPIGSYKKPGKSVTGYRRWKAALTRLTRRFSIGLSIPTPKSPAALEECGLRPALKPPKKLSPPIMFIDVLEKYVSPGRERDVLATAKESMDIHRAYFGGMVTTGSSGLRVSRNQRTSIGAPRSSTFKPACSRTIEVRPSAPTTRSARTSIVPRGVFA